MTPLAKLNALDCLLHPVQTALRVRALWKAYTESREHANRLLTELRRVQEELRKERQKSLGSWGRYWS